MFSTSVLECRKSLDREAPRRGLFAWDKENRPSDANKDRRDWGTASECGVALFRLMRCRMAF